MSRITAFYARDFKRLKQLEFVPDPWSVIVVGRNTAGKSSALDAIAATLCGKNASPGVPVRKGARSAECTLEIGQLKVTRTWNDQGTTRLTVLKADGSRAGAPQALLDALVGDVAFDPHSFTRMPAKEQASVLRRLAGIDAQLLKFDQRAAELSEERKEVNKAVKADEAKMAEFPTAAEFAGIPDSAPSVGEAAAAYQVAVSRNTANEEIRREARRRRKEADDALAKTTECSERVEAARQALSRAQANLDLALSAHKVAESEAGIAKGKAENLDDSDLIAARSALDNAEALADKVRTKKAREEVWLRLTENKLTADELTKKLEGIARGKEGLLSGAAYPVKGLEVYADEVRLNGVPLEQASSAEQIRTGLAVCAALNPTLRVAMIRDGSLLDEDGMREICTWAASNDFQVWLERVGDTNAPQGLVIENGELFADRQQPASPPPAVAVCDEEPRPDDQE